MTRIGRYAVMVAGLACALDFAVVTWLVSLGIFEVLDAQFSVAVRSMRTPALTALMRAVTFSGDWLFVGLATAVLVAALVAASRRREAVTAIVMVVGGAALSWVAKEIVGRVRPPAGSALTPLPTSDAFPSGHTVAAACLAAALLVAVCSTSTRLRFAAVGVIALYPVAVGFSRVYLGVHWPSDVVAAGLLAGAWSAFVVRAGATSRAVA